MNRILRIFVTTFYLGQLFIQPLAWAQEGSEGGGLPVLSDVRVDGNSVILDLNQLMPYDVFSLSSPWRLVIEIPGTVYQTGFSRRKINTQLVKRIRGYQFKENPLIARVVLDLKGPVDYNASTSESQVVLQLKKNEMAQNRDAAKKANKKKSLRAARKRDLLDSLPKEVVSLDFEGADIRDVIRLMSETSNINMIFGPEVSGAISIHLKKVPFSEAFKTILNLKGLVATQLGGNILRITTPNNLQADKTKAITYTKIIPVNYLKADAMKKHLQAVMSTSGRKGTITVVKETNSLVITDSQEGLSQSERLISKLDEKPKQVLIESRIVEINLNNGFDIGIQWEYSGINEDLNSDGSLDEFSYIGGRGQEGRIAWEGVTGFPEETGPFGPGGPGTGINLPGPASAAITFGFMKKDDLFAATLASLVTTSKARVLSSPKVVTINGEKARIEAVQDIPFRTATVSASGAVAESFTNVSAGIILDVTPTINADERITLVIKPESSFPTQESTDAGPIIRTRSAQTTVIIKDGETLVIGGLIDDTDTTGENKVPILGDIPIIGMFFRNQTDRKIRNELLVFVTPRIIKD
ncbi:hypothetical protein BVX98_03190 [bacterium F11]|nr:hypothetical protein BVX98_03190 [bacterium F11]